MEPIEQLSYILPTLNALVDRIDADQLDNPTPCAEFTVRDVLDHMLGLGGAFGYWFRGLDVPAEAPPIVTDRVPAAEFRTTMDDLLDAVKSDGALDRTITAPVGVMQGDVFARLVAFDGLIHGWDLARATGLDYALPPFVVDAVDAFARTALSPEMRDGDTFKAETLAPEDASTLERLVAFSGRSL